jgi:molecular chaperone DnaK (HSP70)
MDAGSGVMRYGVGIDLGTSFTSAALLGADGARMVPLSRGVVVPSVAYATPEGTLLTGLAAEEAARGGEWPAGSRDASATPRRWFSAAPPTPPTR